MLQAPVSSLFTVDDRTVSMPCEGEGPIPVVLLAGGTDSGTVWDEVVADLGDDVLTCRFDAPGTGGSEDPVAPVTASSRADTLADTLDAAGLPDRVIVVAHSLGGQTARQFGDRHPDRLAGAVMIDPTTRLAVLSLRDDLTATGWNAAVAAAEAETPVRWPPVPLVVLSHDPDRGDLGAPSIEQLWSDGKAEYAALSAQSRHEIVTGAGHYIHVDAPSAVKEAILDVLDRSPVPN